MFVAVIGVLVMILALSLFLGTLDSDPGDGAEWASVAALVFVVGIVLLVVGLFLVF